MSRPRLTAVALVVLGSVLAAACAAKAAPSTRASAPVHHSTTTAPTTTVATGPPYPLTGVPMVDPSVADHPAVVVKMDNSPWARPQVGINQADIVFEILVEGITRFALVYGSQTPATVGPVRSARSSDIDLLAGLGTPLLAWSGANPTVTRQVETAVAQGLLIDASRGANPPEYWRDDTRQAPHNLFTSIPLLLATFGRGDTKAPQAILPIAPTGTARPASATPLAGVTINFGSGVVVQYAWDAPTATRPGGWARFQIDQLHDAAHSATLDSAGGAGRAAQPGHPVHALRRVGGRSQVAPGRDGRVGHRTGAGRRLPDPHNVEPRRQHRSLFLHHRRRRGPTRWARVAPGWRCPRWARRCPRSTRPRPPACWPCPADRPAGRDRFGR